MTFVKKNKFWFWFVAALMIAVPVFVGADIHFTKQGGGGTVTIVGSPTPVYDVTDNGVETGFTDTVNAAALQALVATVDSVGGGTLYFPPGIYPMANVITTGYSNLRFLGECGGSILDNSGNITPLFNLPDTTDFVFECLTFRGDFATNADAVGTFGSQKAIVTDNGAGAGETSNIKILRCTCDFLSGDCIRIGPNTREVWVEQTYMSGGLGFVEIQGWDDELGDYRPVRAVFITDNKLLGTVTAPNSYRPDGVNGSDDMIDMKGAIEDIIIEGNSFDAQRDITTTTAHDKAIFISARNDTGRNNINNVLITDNQFRRYVSKRTTFNVGPLWDSTAVLVWADLAADTNKEIHNVRVINNQIYDGWFGIHMYDLKYTTVVSGNTMTKIWGGIRETNGNNGVIEYNQIYEAYGSKAIKIANTTGTTIRGNVVTRSDYTCTVTPTDCENTIHADIYLTTGTGRIVVGNLIDGVIMPVPTGIMIVAGIDDIVDNNIVSNYTTGVHIRFAAVTGTRVGREIYTGNGTDFNDQGTSTVLGTAW